MRYSFSKERPILYSGAMVRAILSGNKTQTRRVVKGDWLFDGDESGCGWLPPACPHGLIGDQLWVRETFALWPEEGEGEGPGIAYRADDESFDPFTSYWRPSIHMPRWASRIALEITDVRVQQVQDISDEDILAEGVAEYAASLKLSTSPRLAWIHLWEAINGKRCDGRYGWHRNPWVWAITFRTIGEA
jgi:hypothetical protein